MNVRALLLPLVAALLAAGLIAVHVASGGDDYEPTPPADPCVERPLGPRTTDLEPLAEQLVLIGIQRAACTLGITRERLVLALPRAQDRRELAREIGRPEPALGDAIKAGLNHGITRLERGGRLPKASSLIDSYVDELGLPGLAESAVKRLPDRVVDDLLPTGPVLRRALARTDVNVLLQGIDDPDALEKRLKDQILDSAKDEARERLLDKLPAGLGSLLDRFL